MTKVVVLGLGGMGSAAAAHLARRGADVVGVEQFTPAHDRGSSHGDTRIIRQAYFEDPAYVPLLLHVYDLWADLERDDPGIFRLTGGLMVGRPDAEVVAGSLASVREHGLPHELLDAGEIRSRFPNFAPADDEIGLYETRSGFVRPERTVQEHVRRALAAGADLRFEERALAWEADDAGVRVTTSRRTVEGDRLVVAPGAWAPQLLADLAVPMTVTRELVFWFEPSADPASYEPGRQPIFIWERPGASLYGFPCLDGVGRGAKIGLHRHGRPTDPDALDREVAAHEVEEVTAVLRELVFWFEPSADLASYEPGRQPIFIWERPGASLYGFPCLDGVGRGAKIGLHRHGLPTDPDGLDREVAAHEVEEVTAVLRELVPTLPGTYLRSVACLYTTTPDQDFVIGPHPEHPNVTVACGFSGHGFKFVPVVGEVLADLALEGTTRHPIGLFDPTRFR